MVIDAGNEFGNLGSNSGRIAFPIELIPLGKSVKPNMLLSAMGK